MIGPLALLFIALVCAWSSKPDTRYLQPLHISLLTKPAETVDLPEKGRYVVFYARGLDYDAKTSPYKVEEILNQQPYWVNLMNAVGETKITVKDMDGNPIKTGTIPPRFLYKVGKPPKWIWSRPIFAFTTLRPGKFQIEIEQPPEVKHAMGVFSIGSLTRPDDSNSFPFLLSTFALPAGMLVYLWALLAATPWGYLADRYKKDCEYSKLKPAGSDATVGRVRMSMIPTQKMLFLETSEGIHLAISGLAHHLGFVPIFIAWNDFSEAVRKDEFLDLKVTKPKTTISIRANLLFEAEKNIRSPVINSEPSLAHTPSKNPSQEAEETSLEATSLEATSNSGKEAQVQSSEPLPRAQRAGLGIGLIMMGLLLAKFFIYDTLQMAHAKMAKVTVIDGIVCFAPFSMVVGIIILVHTLMNKTPDTTPQTAKPPFYWQMVGFAIAVPILAFYIWFRFELSRLGYPFFGR